MRLFLVVLAASGLGGCDKIIGLQRPPDPMDIDAPANGHDEDGDGLVDAEDNCPGIKANQTDSDMDGVGDACDLNPTADDDIAMFYTFESGADWEPVGGNWSFTGDQLVFKGGTNMDAIIARRGASKQFMPPLVVEARFKVSSLVNFSAFSVTANLDPEGLGVACSLRRKADGTDEVLVFRPGQDNPTTINPIDPTTTFTARLTVTTTRVSCEIRGMDPTQGGASSVMFADPHIGAIGFEGLQLDANIDYVVVYTSR